MIRRNFLKVAVALGIATAAPLESSIRIDELGESVYTPPPDDLRTDTYRTVITFDNGPGGPRSHCLNALGAAGLESERKALILHPELFMIVRSDGDISSDMSQKFELRRFF